MQGSVLSVPAFSAPFVFIGGPKWIGTNIINPSRLNPQNEILLPWNASFENWHGFCFDAAIAPKIRLDHIAAIKDVLQNDLFAIVPQMVARYLQTSRPELTICSLEEGPPDELIHCLTSASSYQKPQVQFFLSLLKENLLMNSDVHCLLD